VLHEFSVPEGDDPTGGVIVDRTGITNGVPGTLYGTARSGGSGFGTVWSLTPPAKPKDQWTFALIHPFESGDDGATPGTGLLLDAATGQLYGTTESVAGCPNQCGSVFRLDPAERRGGKWTIHRLARLRFGNGKREIDYVPNSALVFDRQNDLLGTANGLAGAVYRAFHTGRGELLYAPDFKVGKDVGDHPQGIVVDRSGLVYGTAFDGGANGIGTVFQLAGVRNNKVLTVFDGAHGANPLAGPILDPSGTLYGTTWRGGNPNACPNSPGCGTVWKRLRNSSAHAVIVLHSFAFFTDLKDGEMGQIGQPAAAPLAREPATGTLYGTTLYGGTGTQCGGSHGDCGTVFRVDADGAYEVLWDFPNQRKAPDNCSGKACPAAPLGLLALFKGAVYGTSYDGGKPCPDGHYLGCGTVWKLTP
jgi:uncharacterized repeat protein (TIGR03803 family)